MVMMCLTLQVFTQTPCHTHWARGAALKLLCGIRVGPNEVGGKLCGSYGGLFLSRTPYIVWINFPYSNPASFLPPHLDLP